MVYPHVTKATIKAFHDSFSSLDSSVMAQAGSYTVRLTVECHQ